MNDDDDFSSIISEQTSRQFRDLLAGDVLAAASAGRWQPALWQAVEASSLSLALVPEAEGGVGLAATDALEIVRLCGYHGLPLPLGDTLAAKALWSAAGGDLRLAGDAPVLLATQAGGVPAAWEEGHVTALLEPVAFGDIDAQVLLHAQSVTGEDFLLLLDARTLSRQFTAGPAPETQCAIRLDAMAVDVQRCRPWQPAHPLALHALGALLRSVQMVGAMQRALELGLQYAGERSQFGKTISRFAPVQDMLVEAAAETAAAVTAAGLAVAHWTPECSDDGLFCIAAAKVRCGEAAGQVSALIHQVHGAIGFTQEHQLHRFTRRLWAWRDDFGSESFWSRWIGQQVCAAPGAALWPRLAAL